MDSHSQPKPQPEEAGSAKVKLCKIQRFLREFRKKKSLRKDSRRNLDGEFKKHLSKLALLRHNIQKLKNEYKKLKMMKKHHINKYAIAKLLSDATMLLENCQKFPDNFWQDLYDCLIDDRQNLVSIDTTCFYYEACIHICTLIADSCVSHQEDKDRARLELAMHEVRVGNIETADEIASQIIDEELQSRLANFKENFRGIQIQPEQAGLAKVEFQLWEFYLFFNEFHENGSLSKNSRQKLDDESENNLSKLRDLTREIEERKDELKKFKMMFLHHIDEYAIAKLLFDATMLLENCQKFPANFWQDLYDCLIGDDPKSVAIDMTRLCYKICLDICKLIADSCASDQEDKDHARLELAMHEVRVGNIETADEIASRIIDEELQGCYLTRKDNFMRRQHRY